jgi:L-asparaginase II
MTTSLQPRLSISVPGNAFAGDVPLVAVMRGQEVGSLHRGTAAVADVEGQILVSLGDPSQQAFLRSSAKPFQLLPAVLSGAVDRFGVTQRELAVLAASHSAEPRHQEAVLSVLEKAGLSEEALRCGVHPPLHEGTARQRLAEGRDPSPVCNNCSGAHAGMLIACRAQGWSTDDYGRSDHPLQRSTREILAVFAGIAPGEIGLAVDNCAVPTFQLPIGRTAVAFARFVTGRGVPPHLAQAAARVSSAMRAYPEMVAGEGRFDSDLMDAAEGAVLSKGGAEGFQGIGLVNRGLGLALKISDGNARASAPSAMEILRSLGALNGPSLERLQQYVRPAVHNHQGELVGRLHTVFHIEMPT